MKNLKMRFAIVGLFIAVLVGTSIEQAHSQWNWQSPVPQGNNLLAVQFLDSLHGWAVGEYGTMLHTTTGGITWYEQEYGRTDNILALSMVTLLEGWAVGDNGTILHTTDSGDDWLEQSSGITTGLNNVAFLDTLNGWAIGDNEIILHTSDGGNHWTQQHQLPASGSLIGIWLLSASEGWAVGSAGRILHTTDGGLTWSGRSVGFAILSAITFTDPLTGVVVGDKGTILQTTDGGINWTSSTTGDTTNLNNILMQSSLVGWIVGDVGKVYRTINGGSSWSSSVVGDGSNINGIARLDGKMWIVGELGRIQLSLTSGTTWSFLDSGSRLSANWIDFPTPDIGVAVGQTGLILRTTNAGITWAEQTSPSPSLSCYGDKFTDANHGWAVGDNGLILRTTDGTTWTTQASNVTHTLFGITFSDSSNGWIVGGEFSGNTGIILSSTDKGNSWVSRGGTIPSILYGVASPTPSSVWSVGAQGYITHSGNGGSAWTPQASGTAHDLFWVSMFDSLNGWVVGDSGTILRTYDGGASWQGQTGGVTVPLFSMVILSPLEAAAVGDSGTVLVTMDGGSTWIPQYSRTLNSLFGVASNMNGLVVTAGDYGSIIANTLQPPGGNIFAYAVDAGWNILSEPLIVSNYLRSAIYPTAISNAFSFNDTAGYSVADTLEPGIGYWIKFSRQQYVWLYGSKIPADSIPLFPGWNMIGNLSDSLAASTIITIPPGIISSNIFGYYNGYTSVATLLPGKGYWIKVSAPGIMILTTTPGSTKIALSANVPYSTNSITLSTDEGGRKTLFFGSSLREADIRRSALPPKPPEGSFDARFQTGTEAYSFGQQNGDSAFIDFTTVSKKLNVRWNVDLHSADRYLLADPITGDVIAHFNSSQGTLTVNSKGAGTFVLLREPSGSGNSMPTHFALQQNTPNPFNPSTQITFELPVKSQTLLEIFDLLGRRITTLTEGVLEAGVHSVQWRPTVSSGIYLYRLTAQGVGEKTVRFSECKKMVYVK